MKVEVEVGKNMEGGEGGVVMIVSLVIQVKIASVMLILEKRKKERGWG